MTRFYHMSDSRSTPAITKTYDSNIAAPTPIGSFVRCEGIDGVFFADPYGFIFPHEDALKIISAWRLFLDTFDDKAIEEYNANIVQEYETQLSRRAEAKPAHTPKGMEGYVYLLSSPHGFKIGRCKNLNVRQQQIATKLPFDVKREHAIKATIPQRSKRSFTMHLQHKGFRASGSI